MFTAECERSLCTRLSAAVVEGARTHRTSRHPHEFVSVPDVGPSSSHYPTSRALTAGLNFGSGTIKQRDMANLIFAISDAFEALGRKQ